jgi:uncharacterized membrane protein
MASENWARVPINTLVHRHGDAVAWWGLGLSAIVIVGLLAGLLFYKSVPVYIASVAVWISVLAAAAALLRYLAHGQGGEYARMDRLGKYFGFGAAAFAVINSVIALFFALATAR